MSMLADLTVTPLSPALGAEVSGVDLSRDVPDDVLEEIRAAWQKYNVLVIRGQDLTMEQQLAFAGRFGELGERKRQKTAFKKKEEGVYQTNPHTLLVTNIMVDGKPIGAFNEGDMWFHIDSGYAERPYKYTFLYGMELPSTGGNTRFANTYTAYEKLPEDLKKQIEGRRALHIHQYKRVEKVDLSVDISSSPHWYHPVVITHPETGRKALFVDRLMTAAIEGLERAESDALMERLYDHVETPAFIYEHVWQLKDFLMWDNRCVVHGRTWFPEDERRLLRRCTIEGDPLSA
ncbi:MAG: taurine dioxygenase [Alphaproteobacteria bacterium]|jgi:taurine dioxygenase